MTDARLTQQSVDVIQFDADAEARLTQQSADVLQYGAASQARLTQQSVDVLLYDIESLAGGPVWAWSKGGPSWGGA